MTLKKMCQRGLGGLSFLLLLSCSEPHQVELAPQFCESQAEVTTPPSNESHPFADDTDDILQMGDKISREPVDRDQIDDPLIGPAIRNYVSFFRASGFYLGEFQGWHLIATSYHFINDEQCQQGQDFLMPFVPLRGRTQLCVMSNAELDLRILAFQESRSRRIERLGPLGMSFDFQSPPQQNEPLFVIGKTIHESARPGAYLIQDDDCRVTSRSGDFGTVSTEIGPIQAFAVGCDLSHGDSGAAVHSRRTGLILGLVSHGTPKRSRNFSCSQGIQQQLAFDYNSVWDMNLVTPAFQYRQAFLNFTLDNRESELSRMLIQELLSANPQ